MIESRIQLPCLTSDDNAVRRLAQPVNVGGTLARGLRIVELANPGAEPPDLPPSLAAFPGHITIVSSNGEALIHRQCAHAVT